MSKFPKVPYPKFANVPRVRQPRKCPGCGIVRDAMQFPPLAMTPKSWLIDGKVPCQFCLKDKDENESKR